MEEKREFGYVAKLPTEEGKKKKLGTKAAPIDYREKEMIDRVTKRVKLPSVGWEELQKDLKNKEPKNFIARKFGIKPNDLKWLKKYLQV
jgi:hypothetical protein